jgi:hypothetical protein
VTWLGPNELWDIHPRPEAQRALQDVRDLGWSFRPASDHAFGTIKCPYAHHNDGGCTLSVLRTSGPLDGSVTANEIRRAVRRCDRLGDTDPAKANAKLRVDLRQVDGVLEGAEKLRDSESLQQEAYEVLAEAANGSTAAQEIALDEAVELEEKAQVANREALVAASRFGLEDPWPPDQGAAELALAARERLNEVLEGFSGEIDETSQALIDELEERLQDFAQ